MKKRGIFFSIDALIALLMIFLVVLIAYPQIKQRNIESKLDQDLLVSLSSITVKDFDNAYVQSLIVSGTITNQNNTLLEQIGEFYVTNPAIASQIANEFLNSIETKEDVGIWMENTLIASKNSSAIENANQIDTSRQIISGVIAGQNITGYSARAYLSSNVKQKYVYFGGYVGDGNLTTTIEYNGTIQEAKLEIACNKDFELYINNQYAGSYTKSSSDTSPIQHDLTSQISKFSNGINKIEFRASNFYIAGGFLRIEYDSEPTTETKKYYFPAVEGLINIYDGIYFPNIPSTIDIYLDLNSTFQTFLNIGNVTVYNGTTIGRQTINIPNSALVSQLNYEQLSNKTIPIRLGLRNVSLIYNKQFIDVSSVVDLSGSMQDNCPGGTANPGETPCKINDAKNATNNLIDAILNISGNRVALSGFEDYAKKADFHNLSNNSASLKNIVNNVWNADGLTCICCGILEAISCFDNSIFKDYFNDQVNGTNPLGWVLSQSGGAVDIVTSALEGNGSMYIKRNSGNPSAHHIFNAQQNAVIIEFLANHQSGASGRMRLEIEGMDNANNYQDYIILKMYGGYIRNNNAQLIPYNLNQTYKMKVRILPGTNNFGLWVDDVLVNNNLAVVSSYTNVGRLRFTTENDVINYKIDSINVTLQDNTCTNMENRTREMIVMSDGEANQACGLDPSPDWDGDGTTIGDYQDQAIESACIAKTKHNLTVHAIAFDINSGSLAEQTMQGIAACGQGGFYSSNVTQLTQVYQQITQSILATYNAQTLNASGNQKSQLYSNSYISFNYQQPITPFGISITGEQPFMNSTLANFSMPQNSTVISATAISYSGALWTNKVKLNNNTIYNLNNYGPIYTELGDPYAIHLPVNNILPSNNLELTVASSPSLNGTGSIDNKIIYTVIKNVSAYSPISASQSGCLWTTYFEDSTNTTINVPSNYTGSSNCAYSPSGISYNINDALQYATYNLFAQLDLDNDGRLDFIFGSGDVTIATSEVTGIPFPWSTEAQIRRWS